MTASSLWDNPIDVAIHLGLKTGQEDESVYDGLLQQQQQQLYCLAMTRLNLSIQYTFNV